MISGGKINYHWQTNFTGTYNFISEDEFPLKQVTISANRSEELTITCILDGGLIDELELEKLRGRFRAWKSLASNQFRVIWNEGDKFADTPHLLGKFLNYLKAPVKQNPQKLLPLFKTINSLLSDLRKDYIGSIEMLAAYTPLDQATQELLEDKSDYVENYRMAFLKYHCDRFPANSPRDYLEKILKFAIDINVPSNSKHYADLQHYIIQIKCRITPLHSMNSEQLQEVFVYESNLKSPDKAKIDTIRTLLNLRQSQLQASGPPAFDEPPLYDDVALKELKHEPNVVPPIPKAVDGVDREIKEQMFAVSVSALNSMHGFLSSSSSSQVPLSNPKASQVEIPEPQLLKIFFTLYDELEPEPENKKFTKYPNIKMFSLSEIISHAKQFPSQKCLLSYTCTLLRWVNPMGKLCRNTAPPAVITAYENCTELAVLVTHSMMGRRIQTSPINS